jgi:hypothetical protein
LSLGILLALMVAESLVSKANIYPVLKCVKPQERLVNTSLLKTPKLKSKAYSTNQIITIG